MCPLLHLYDLSAPMNITLIRIIPRVKRNNVDNAYFVGYYQFIGGSMSEELATKQVTPMEMIQVAFDAAIKQGSAMEVAVRNLTRHIIVDPVDGCWNWQAAKNRDGYGIFTGKKSPVGRLAHRVSYFLATGISPKGFDVHHRCKNRQCVNPGHIEMLAKPEHSSLDSLNGAKTHCLRGHPFEGENLYHHPNGTRRCRTCHADYQRLRRAQKGKL